VQEAYIRAFKGFHRFRGGNSRAWFLTIVRNTAYSWLNNHARDEKLIPYDEEKHADIISINPAEDKLIFEGRKKHLQRVLERLAVSFVR
jgi:RNA polymerase sigma-70 factor, ECF subfamily